MNETPPGLPVGLPYKRDPLTVRGRMGRREPRGQRGLDKLRPLVHIVPFVHSADPE
jgi:hypothetical protein